MFKKLLSLVLVGVMAIDLFGCSQPAPTVSYDSSGVSNSSNQVKNDNTNKASNYSDADFKDYVYCYIDGRGILHFTSKENKAEFSYIKWETGRNLADKNLNVISGGASELTKYVYVIRDSEEITIDDRILINFGGLFEDGQKLKKINNIENLVTTDMDFMFARCESLETLDLSKMDVSHVKSMTRTFDHCINLKSLNVSNWNTSKVEEMWGTFSDCWNLTTLDIGNWDVSNVKNMTDMFNGCKNLTTLNIENWDVSNVKYMRDTFSTCYKLTVIPSWYDKNKK